MKYQRFTSSGCKDKGIRKFEFVGKNQFLCGNYLEIPKNLQNLIYSKFNGLYNGPYSLWNMKTTFDNNIDIWWWWWYSLQAYSDWKSTLKWTVSVNTAQLLCLFYVHRTFEIHNLSLTVVFLIHSVLGLIVFSSWT